MYGTTNKINKETNVKEVQYGSQRCKLVLTKSLTQEISYIYDDEFTIQKKMRKSMGFSILSPSVNKRQHSAQLSEQVRVTKYSKDNGKIFQHNKAL